jgi:hypothetical protein
MSVIQVPGRVSGRNYSVQISGDTPTPTEQERIRQYVAQQEAQFTQSYSQAFGQEPVVDDGTALGRGWELGKAGAYSRLGTATEYLGSGLGIESLSRTGQRMRAEGDFEAFLDSMRQPEPMRREDVTGIGSTLTWLGEGIGQSGPEMLAPLAAGAAGTLLGGPAAGLGAGAATAFPSFFGGNIQRQEGEVAAGRLAEVDTSAAIVAAIGQSAINSVADKLLLGGFLKPGQKWLTRSAIGAAEGAVVEAPSEIAQQMLERKQAGLPLDSDDAISEYIDAGILGGVMGGGIRGTTAGLGIGVERPAAPPPAAGAIASRIIPPSSGPVRPGPATAGNKTTVTSGGRTVTRVKLSDGAVLEFETTPTQAQIDAALVQYNGAKAAPQAAPPGGIDPATLQTQPQLPLPDPVAPLRPRFVEGQDQGDMFGTTLGDVGPPQSAPQVVPFTGPISDTEFRALSEVDRLRYLDEVGMPPVLEAPAAPGATPTDYEAILDQLGVPANGCGRKTFICSYNSSAEADCT